MIPAAIVFVATASIDFGLTDVAWRKIRHWLNAVKGTPHMVVPPFRPGHAAGRRRAIWTAAGGAALLLARWSAAAAQTATPTGATRNILDTLAAGQFTTLVRALQAAGLTDTLRGAGPFTVFAPTDAAFAKIPADQFNAILTNPDQLTKVLTYHAVAGRVPISQVAAQSSFNTVQGEPIRVAAQGGAVTLNGTSRVVQADIAATNGLIHAVDTVLVPPSLATAAPTPAPSTPANPNVARDGQTLAAQPQSVQQLFQAAWGDQAATRWVEEHNAELSRAGR
jgi:uncharacterized surface protein with fasciclin (FAS1) repeats